MPFADIFSGPPASRTRSTAGRRSTRRPTSWFDAAAAAASSAAGTGGYRDAGGASSAFRATRHRRPMSTSAAPGAYRTYSTVPSADDTHAYRAATTAEAATTAAPMSGAARVSTPGSDADVLVRGVALAVAAVALAVVFLNIALHVALVAAALVVPAWRTFKTLEAGPHSTPTVVEIIDEDMDDDDDDDDDDPTDADYRPETDAEVEELDDMDDDDDVTADGARARAAPGRTGARAPRGRAPRAACPARVGGDATAWQKYWAIAGLLFGAHALALRSVVGVVVPGAVYRGAALVLFTWLNGNGGGNAASAYDGVVRPLLLRSETAVDAAAASVTDRADEAVRRALLSVNSVVSPYFQQLEAAAQSSRARMEEAERARVASRGYFD